jgi:NOL1/NOP2/sun family putative RNA methylase
MAKQLGVEYPAFLESMSAPGVGGLRINRLKVPPGKDASVLPPGAKRVPWCESGYWFGSGHLSKMPGHLSKMPHYAAGLYYIQEPSAMAPVEMLDVRPGDYVLDLCAAPGGKSTQIAGKLQGQGLLFANDASASRAKALLKNLEMAGVANMCVSCEQPERLADVLGQFFDKVLVDAPCSGEGMFRKDPGSAKAWTAHTPATYVPAQREILRQAVRMLKPGGTLVYSTCTFSEEENEGVVGWLLGQCAEGPSCEMAKDCVRLYPHRVEGEGHFMASLRKKGETGRRAPEAYGPTQFDATGINGEQEFWSFMEDFAFPLDPARLYLIEDTGKDRKRPKDATTQVYLLPDGFPAWTLGGKPACVYGKDPGGESKRSHGRASAPSGSGALRYLRTGLKLGSLERGRFAPSQALAMCLDPLDVKRFLGLGPDDGRLVKYLKGETIDVEETDMLGPMNEKGTWGDDLAMGKKRMGNGWAVVGIRMPDGACYPLGFGKCQDGMVKNHYAPGWRWT